MNLRLIAVDKIRTRYVADACAEYRKRLGRYWPYEEIEVRASNAREPLVAMSDEAERILHLVRSEDRVWLLERTGTELESGELAHRINQTAYEGITRLTFVIAGTFGADPALHERADLLWSLSRLTLLHEWARMVVLEQVYRAAKILRNEPYHH
jgi:23S rRNA (pseudouridine1915-N3)-methyltransferase